MQGTSNSPGIEYHFYLDTLNLTTIIYKMKKDQGNKNESVFFYFN